jgi:hypothetical protein
MFVPANRLAALIELALHGKKGEVQMRLTRLFLRLLAIAIVVNGFLLSSAAAQTRGMVLDNGTKKAVVFDADADTVIGSVVIGNTNSFPGDCSISSDQSLGFATDLAQHVWVIDLSSASLASGTNVINISNPAEDTSLSPDGKFLLVCDGGSVSGVAVVDVASRTQLSTLSLGTDCNSVEVCSNSSVLVTSLSSGNVRRLSLSDSGVLTDTGDVLFSGGTGVFLGPNNAVCAPGGASGFVVRRDPREIRSFTIPGLSLVDTRTLTGTVFSGISGVFSASGDEAYVRSNGGAVDVFSFDPATAALGATPLLSFPIASSNTFFGMDQMALHPNGAKLYVSQPGALNVYDASTGALLKSITDSAISLPTGVCLPAPSQSQCASPSITAMSAEPSVLWPPNHKMVEVTVGYTATSDCSVSCSLQVSSNESVNGIGDGNASPDWEVVDANRVLLRAERSATGNGRAYTISVDCENSSGKSSSDSVTVTVPFAEDAPDAGAAQKRPHK